MKPTLDLYTGQKVIAITRGEEPWEWGIKLESGVEIRNKNREEIFRPMKLVNTRIMAYSLSPRDTTIHFAGEGASKVTVSFKPTQYAIVDPKHGGEVYPQWPEELEERGIPSHPEEEISALPGNEWPAEEERLVNERERRIQQQAQEFLKED